MNSIAGGGTLLTFPALIGLGVPALTANATSTVALWPGAVGSMLGYLGELRGARAWAIRFAVPSLAGGLAGALLLLVTPAERFDALVPWLVLGATGLFLVQRPAMRWLREHAPSRRSGELGHASPDPTLAPPSATALAYQFAVGVYGGYFGAGIGMLTLALLALLGPASLHRMNAMKSVIVASINGAATVYFLAKGRVELWPALVMAAGAIVGGYGGAAVARRVDPRRVRWVVVAIGVGLSALLGLRYYR